MRPLRFLSVPAGMCLSLVIWAQDPSTYNPYTNARTIVFDAPDAGTDASEGTYVQGITETGYIAGFFIDSQRVFHGFIREPDGAMKVIDSPDAGQGAVEGTMISAMNTNGEVAGDYIDTDGQRHGFLRRRDGTFTSFDVPGADVARYGGAFSANINDQGTISGYFYDGSGYEHCFLRKRNGEFTTFEVPGQDSSQSPLMPNFYGMNERDEIAGSYSDVGLINGAAVRGWLRRRDGAIVEFDGPLIPIVTNVKAINRDGFITGDVISERQSHGFVRDPNCNFTTIDVPGATGTTARSINAKGEIVGDYSDSAHFEHGFVRSPDGSIAQFTVSGTGPGTSNTALDLGISARGWVAGFISDQNGVHHGFVLIPQRAKDRDRDHDHDHDH